MPKPDESLWIATVSSPDYGGFADNERFDAIVVGAGITGITAALLLKERGKRVAIVEKERLAEGESGHTTAHLTEAVDARYYFLARAFSKEVAQQIAQVSRAAIEQIASLIAKYRIECHFERLPGYLYTEKRSDVAELKREAAAAADAGVAAKFTDDVPLPFPTRGGVVFDDQAQFHPREYLVALASHIPGDGSSIFDRTHVTKIRSGSPCVVETTRGKLFADAVLMATNVPIEGFQTLFVKDAAYRTYALAFEAAGDHPHGLFWDTDDPYHYTRWQRTGEGTFLVVGGEDHKVGQAEHTENRFETLRKFAQERFGGAKVRYRWSGQVIEPVDGLPYIGGSGPLYVSTGYAGQGMTFGTAGAMIVADLMTDRANDRARLFDPARVHVRHSIKELLAENVDFPRHLVTDRVMNSDVETTRLAEVKSGEGRIVELEGKKAAVHRDVAGQVHVLSPVCTHMKCDVAWNSAEKSWDCPCHGSRFGVDGQVLNGPAREPLERVDAGEEEARRWRRERDSNPR